MKEDNGLLIQTVTKVVEDNCFLKDENHKLVQRLNSGEKKINFAEHNVNSVKDQNLSQEKRIKLVEDETKKKLIITYSVDLQN